MRTGMTHARSPLAVLTLAVVLIAAAPDYAAAPDDSLTRDRGARDIAAQVRRFNRVNNILQRAIKRYDAIIADIGTPSSDPEVQAALQAILDSAAGLMGVTGGDDGIINKVLEDPGPVLDPAVRNTLTMIASIGDQLSRDARAKLAGGGPP